MALVIAFYEWARQAEFSADRAGLLVSQSLDDCIDSLITMTGGNHRHTPELNRDAYLDQAETYRNADPVDQAGKAILFYLFNWQMTHPFPVARVQELKRWYDTGAFDQILAGDYSRMAKVGAA